MLKSSREPREGAGWVAPLCAPPRCWQSPWPQAGFIHPPLAAMSKFGFRDRYFSLDQPTQMKKNPQIRFRDTRAR